MALESFGLGGVLSFKADRAIATMGKVSSAFGKMRGQAKKFGQGGAQLARGIGIASLAMLPFTAGVAGAAKAAVSFEQAMADVKALGVETQGEFERLTTFAKKLGSETKFSATEAASGMQFLKRAGADTADIMGGLRGVLDAAAADNIELAQSAEIVANVVKGMGLKFTDATRVADVLAQTSALTNTNIIGLGEAFTEASAQARIMQIPLETTAAVLGAISDAGKKGSAAGTAMTNMLVKLAKPTSKAQKLMKKLGINVKDGSGNLLKMKDLLPNLLDGIGKFKGNVDRAAVASELFGIRGQKAANALFASLKDPKKNFEVLQDAIENSRGAAARMAATKMDTVIGAFTELKSAAEGLFIEVFSPFLPQAKAGLQGITGALRQLVIDLQAGKKTGFAGGILEGIEILKSGFQTAKTFVQDLAKSISEKLGGVGSKKMGKLVIVIGAAVAMLAPLLAGFVGISTIISLAVVPAVGGLITILGAIGIKGLIIFGILSIGFTTIKDAALNAFSSISGAWGAATGNIQTDWGEVGTTVLNVLKAIGQTAASIIGFIIGGIGKLIAAAIIVGGVLLKNIKAPFVIIGNLMGSVLQGWQEIFSGNIIKGLKTLGRTVVDSVLFPLRLLLRTAINLAEGLAFTVPEKLKIFADEGLVGLSANKPKVSAEELAQAKRTRQASRRASEAAIRAKTAEKPDNVSKELSKVAEEIGKDKNIEMNLNQRLCVDGREMAVATARSKIELQERAGFVASPYQRRLALEQGAAPVGVVGG